MAQSLEYHGGILLVIGAFLSLVGTAEYGNPALAVGALLVVVGWIVAAKKKPVEMRLPSTAKRSI